MMPKIQTPVIITPIIDSVEQRNIQELDKINAQAAVFNPKVHNDAIMNDKNNPENTNAVVEEVVNPVIPNTTLPFSKVAPVIPSPTTPYIVPSEVPVEVTPVVQVSGNVNTPTNPSIPVETVQVPSTVPNTTVETTPVVNPTIVKTSI